ncbi:phytanoyl-CoA dioxygenase [Streptomyces sp. NPDC004532]
MDDESVERFLRDGFVKIEGAFPPRVAEGCARLLWKETGYDPDDPGTWKDPVHWVSAMAQGPFAAAANSPALHEAFDLLCGERRWQPRYVLGSFPLRFPHEEEPDDAGWHIEGSYLPEGATLWHTNLWSKDRALLMLFLFSEVGEEDAPTRIRVGSHLDVPPVLEPYGERGASFMELGPKVDAASANWSGTTATTRPWSSRSVRVWPAEAGPGPPTSSDDRDGTRPLRAPRRARGGARSSAVPPEAACPSGPVSAASVTRSGCRSVDMAG